MLYFLIDFLMLNASSPNMCHSSNTDQSDLSILDTFTILVYGTRHSHVILSIGYSILYQLASLLALRRFFDLTMCKTFQKYF